MSLAEFSIKNAVLVNLVMLIVFAVGIISMFIIPKEEMPAVDFGRAFILVIYPGVSPEEVEQQIVNKIEEQIADIDGIDYIESHASEGKAMISVSFEPNADIDKAMNDLNTEMNKVTDLPADALDPTILRLNMREVNPICQVVLGGNFSDDSMREIAENMKEGILNVKNVSKADISGTRQKQLWVDVQAEKLDQYGLTLSDLMSMIQARNMNIPGGTVKFGRAEFIIRTMGEYGKTEDLGTMVVKMDSNGRAIRMNEVSVIKDTLQKVETKDKLNGRRSVSIQIFKKAEGNIISVMDDVKAYVESFSKNIPGLDASIRNDGSIDVKNSIRALGSDSLMGIILVFLALLILLGMRNALLASWSIPFSIFAAFGLMYVMDITVNTLTLFAMILVVGMIVDNAIVVIENSHRHREEGLSTKEAIIKGVDEVIWPLAGTNLCHAAAFIPLLIMQGIMGKFLSVFPIVVTIALTASWFESMIILPAHLYQFAGKSTSKDRTKKVQQAIIHKYQIALKYALKYRYWSVAAICFLFVFSLGLLMSDAITKEFWPTQQPKSILLKLQTPIGTNIDVTENMVNKVENYISNMKEKQDIEAVITTIGSMEVNHQSDVKTSNAQIAIDLVDLEQMKYNHEQIQNSIRAYLKTIPELTSYKFDQVRGGPPSGGDVEIRVKGDNLDKLESIGAIIKNDLKKIPGVEDIEDSFRPGKKEVRIIPDYDKISMYGLTVAQIASTIRTASNGSKASTYRGSSIKEYDLIVKMEDKYVANLEQLKNLKVRTRTGDLIAIKDLATFEVASGLSEITHRDKKRVITITANNTFYTVNGKSKKQTTNKVTEALIGNTFKGTTGSLGHFENRFPGYFIEFGGQAEEQRKSYSSLAWAFLLALFIIFTILATEFKSYVQPLIILTTVPFAFIGVVIGLALTGIALSLNALISIVALSGIVVSNSLLVVDFINRAREEGMDRWHSIIRAGSVRLRPILLTSITAIAGMLPLVFSTSKASYQWKPMAVCMTFGLSFATILTLFIIPCIYSIVDSLFSKLKLSGFEEHMSFEDAMKLEADGKIKLEDIEK